MIDTKLKGATEPGGIVWLASYPKSGNTWLRVFLYHITRVMMGVPLDGNDLNKLDRSSLYEARTFSLFSELIGKPIKDTTPPDIIKARPQVHAELAKRAKGMIFLKTHMPLAKIMDTPTINVDATLGAIYVVRNPLDLVFSLSNHIGLPLDDAITVLCQPAFYSPTGTEEVYEPWGSWSENVNSWTIRRMPSIYIIRYEDMLSFPLRVFTGVMNHLRQKPTDAQIREAVELSSFKRLTEIEKGSNFRERSRSAERFFRVGKADQWQGVLTEEQIGRIVGTHYEMMARAGYLTPELRKYLPAHVDAKTLKPAAAVN
jgi:hypothetical protein